MKMLILGIGNSLLSDEGIGVHVIRALQHGGLGDNDIELMDGGTLSFTLAAPIATAAALVVVDAAQLRAEPGTVAVFEGEAMDRFLLGSRTTSVHEVGLSDLMTITRLTGDWPERRALVAIQPQTVEWGEMPSPPVMAAVPAACEHIRTLIGAWRDAA